MKIKNYILIAIFAIFISFIFLIFIFQAQTPLPESSMLLEKEVEESLDEFSRNIVSGGPPKDGIPPIDNPKYTSVSESDKFLDDNDVVFVVEYGGIIKIFPQKILVWHEIVNDAISAEKVSVTYCPLTGTAIGFKGKFDSIATTLGTSGKLLNSNLVMYDRATDSYWPQILGTAISGSQKGKTLEEFPVIWTTWNKAKAKYPNALVLSTDTGFLRSYGTDPYGSYLRKGTYYDSGVPFFPVMATDNRLPEKEVVIGVRTNNSALAIVKGKLAETKVANLLIDNKPIVALYDDSLDTVRVYARQVNGKVLNFEFKDGNIVDRETNSLWTVFGESILGEIKGTRLKLVNSFDVMWFAWISFYPHTEIYR